MKNFLTLLSLLFVGFVSAQSNGNVTINAGETFARASNASLSSYGASATFFNPRKDVDGSVHLFSGWKNLGVIVTTDNQKFSLNNINLNIERNTFESKISTDSLFTFSFNNIEKFIVNNRVFKTFYYNGDNRIYEMIYESNQFSIMKGYRVQLVEGSTNPMVNRKNSKLVQKSSFYIMHGSSISTFKLSKKRVLALLGSDSDIVKKAEQYAKDNGLSYKKAYDVQRILSFAANE